MAIIGRDCLVLSIGADTDILCYNSQTITQTLAGEIPPTDIFSQDPSYLLRGEQKTGSETEIKKCKKPFYAPFWQCKFQY